jgi:hypothetical protein
LPKKGSGHRKTPQYTADLTIINHSRHCANNLEKAEAEFGIQNPLARDILAQTQQENRDIIDVLMEWFLLHRACRNIDADTCTVYHVKKHAHLPHGLTMKRIKSLRIP